MTYLNLAKKLISLQTQNGNQQAFEQAWYAIDEVLDTYKYKRYMSKGYESRVYYSNGKMPEKFDVVLNGHLDVVPGEKHLFKPTILGDKLFGRGAYDMKAATAVEILLFKELANEVSFKLGLQLVTDEEVGGFNGTEYQLAHGLKTDFALVGESGSNYAVKTKAKGIYWLKATFKGSSAHSSQPWMGVNALYQAQEFLGKLQQAYPVPTQDSWVTTVTPSNIEANNPALNKIPDLVTVFMDARYIPEEVNEVESKVQKLLPKGIVLERMLSGSPLNTDDNHPLVQSLLKICKVKNIDTQLTKSHGSGDMRFYTSVGASAVEFGPLGGNAHNHEEWVSLQSLEHYYQTLKAWLLTIG